MRVSHFVNAGRVHVIEGFLDFESIQGPYKKRMYIQ